MGYHADVQAQLVSLIEAAVPTGVSVVQGLAMSEAETIRNAAFVAIVRDSIEVEPHAEINPSTSTSDQMERWRWLLYVKGGGGAANNPAKGAEVDLILEAVRTALNAQKLTAACGPLHLESEEYEGNSGTGVVYIQTWVHGRL